MGSTLHIIIQIHINTPFVPHIYTHRHGWVRGGGLPINHQQQYYSAIHCRCCDWWRRGKAAGRTPHPTNRCGITTCRQSSRQTPGRWCRYELMAKTHQACPPRVGCCCEMLGSVFKRDCVCVRESFGRVKLLWFGIMWRIWTQRLVMEIIGFIYLLRIKL